MARYVAHVHTPMNAEEAFAYMSDLRNFAEWDPGVSKVEQVVGEGGGPDTEFDVTVKGFTGPLTLRYVTIEHDPDSRALVRAESSMLTSVDLILVRPADTGSVVTYDAELTLNGVLKLADPLLGLAFGRIGDRAASGLVAALDGELVDDAPDAEAATG